MSCGAIFSQWRNWIRPLVITLYVLILLIALPLLIVELNLNNAKTHTQAWLIAGIFVVLAIPISLWGILQHMIHYTQPQLQRHIIRILWMVPIYAMDAWLALRFKDVAIYMDTLRECYEAYVVYNFMAYLLTFLTTQYPDFEAELESKPQVKHIIPFCCLPPWSMGRPLVQYCRHGVLQYTVIRPLTTCIALLCQTQHVYHEGNFNFTSAWSYLAIINNLSQVWAMYCLVLFYLATKEHLAPIKPVAKFMCIKAVVFLTFWQSVLIAALVKVGVIRVDNTMSFYTVEDLATGLQDFIICIEMFFAAIAHYFSFSHIPFVEEDGMQANCFASFTAMWDVSDVRADVVDHVRHVGKTMRKTMRRNQALQTEQSPLLADGGETSYSQTSMPAVTDFPIVGYLGSHGGSIGTINSIDTLTTDMPHSCSFTASMNNYMDLSESIDSHAADQPEYTTPQNEEVSEQLIDLSEDQQSEPISTIEVSSVPVTNSSKPQKGKGKRARGKSARLVDASSASDILKVDSQIPSRGQIDIAQGCQSAEGQIHSAMRDSKPIGSQGQSSADLGQACESQVQQEDNDAQNIKTVAVKGEYVPSTTTSNSQEPTFI